MDAGRGALRASLGSLGRGNVPSFQRAPWRSRCSTFAARAAGSCFFSRDFAGARRCFNWRYCLGSRADFREIIRFLRNFQGNPGFSRISISRRPRAVFNWRYCLGFPRKSGIPFEKSGFLRFLAILAISPILFRFFSISAIPPNLFCFSRLFSAPPILLYLQRGPGKITGTHRDFASSVECCR